MGDKDLAMEIQDEVIPEESIEVPIDTADEQPKKRPVTRRYNRWGKRRGRYAYAAPLGVLISLLAIVGVVALVVTGIGVAKKAADTSGMKEEIYYFLEPVLTYTPAAFADITQTEQDAFLNAAAYRVMQAEQIRMLREGDETCRYAVDDQGRIAVPVTEVEASYRVLFGRDAVLTHRSVEDSSLTYSEADNCYYVPFNVVNSGYKTVINSIKRQGNSTYLVRVGFVPNTAILLDEHGVEMEPTIDMAAHCQTYTLTRTATGYYISACVDS